MIPKIIHYCWFGKKKLPEKDKRNIDGWKRLCPDYQIVEWNENNYDLTKNQYILDAYKEKKWGFVSDYVRLDILFQKGGIYMDTDVELLKPLDDLLINKAYIGFEDKFQVNSGSGMGSEPGNKIVKELRDQYESINFYNEDGSLNLKPCPEYLSEKLQEKGLILNDTFQKLDDITIYPKEYFSPKEFETGKVYITNNTISIHHYAASWYSPYQKLVQKLAYIMGKKNIQIFVRIKRRVVKFIFERKER